jgi:hypothetical protein
MHNEKTKLHLKRYKYRPIFFCFYFYPFDISIMYYANRGYATVYIFYN